MKPLTIRDIDASNKRVLVRVDFNVPLNSKGEITDDSRIKAAIPTIEYLLEQRSKVILMSHMGRPDTKRNDSLSLKIVADRLSQLMRHPVKFINECIGSSVEKAVKTMKSGDIVLLENLRFHPEEEGNDPAFAERLSSLGEIYVDDAFGTAHRRHASIVGVTKKLPAVAGLLLEKEIDSLGHILENPSRPFCVLFGGAKISDKVKLLENIINKVDTILVGGGMAATFLKADNYEVGHSIIDENLESAIKIIAKAKKYGIRLILPRDVIVANGLSLESEGTCVPIEQISITDRIVDIGLLTISLFTKELERCRTVFWNGPMGIYEIPQFAQGTKSMAEVIGRLHATTIIGGGSTAEIVSELNMAHKMSFVSTGGGSSMLFLSGEKLPGVEVLFKKTNISDRSVTQ